MKDNFKLTIEHLAPYLPYALNISLKNDGWPDSIGKMTGINEYHNEHHIEFIENGLKGLATLNETKLILRPLSQLTEDEEEYAKFIVTYESRNIDLDYLCECKGDVSNQLTYDCVAYLLKHHFDLFGLIEQGLAVEKK